MSQIHQALQVSILSRLMLITCIYADNFSTTGEGSQFDYTVNTASVIALANGQIANVVLTLHVDFIAQEANETFTLILNPLVAPSPREGLFFRNTIRVTIVDSDSKDIN